MPETEEERAARKRREAEERRAKETPEERAARKAREAERAKETPEERAARKAREAERAKETPEDREARKRREAEERRAKETPEERAARKARENERAKETPEERAARKAREAERANETPEEREARKRREADERRAKETPEERAARKAREAEERRAKETPEERAARKAKEAADAEARRAAREDRPVIHKQATAAPSPQARKQEETKPKEPEYKPVQATAPKKAQEEEEDDDYDDDDFEEVLDQDQLADAIRATEAENARLRAAAIAEQQARQSSDKQGRGGSSSSEPAVKGKSRAGLDVDSLTRQKHKQQFEKDLQRALTLRRLVDLDEAKHTIVDITPQSQYDVFLRTMASSTVTVKNADGKEETVTTGPIANASAQAPEQRISVEVQAERVSRKTRTMQAPDDLGLFPEGFAAKQTNRRNASTDAAAGGDGDGKDDKGEKKAERRVTALDKRRVDTAALGAFMTSVFPSIRTLLDENDLRYKTGDANARAADASQSSATRELATKQSFSASAPGVLQHTITAGRSVVASSYSQVAAQYAVVAYGPTNAGAAGSAAPQDREWLRASAFDGLALLWNTNEQNRPDKVLVAPAPIVDVCLSPTRNYIVYGALQHGAVCLWDLREPEGAHGGSVTSFGLRSPSYTSGWAETDLHSAPIRRILVAGYNSTTGVRGADEAEQAITLGEDGEMVYWMLSDGGRAAAGSSSGGHGGGGGAASGGGGGGELRRSNSSASFAALHSPSRRRHAADSNDLGMGLGATVHLYKAAGINVLDDVRSQSASKKSAADDMQLNYGLPDAATSKVARISSVAVDFDTSPTDASHVLVAGSTAVHHVSKFGSIAAPSQYGGALGGSSLTTPATTLSTCPTDSRLLLVGYENGSVRLFLRDEAEPVYNTQLASSAITAVRWSTNRRWIAFVLDADGCLNVLDLAGNNKSKPVATTQASNPASRYTSIAVSYEERETHLAIGTANGNVVVHTVNLDAVLPVAMQRNERWL